MYKIGDLLIYGSYGVCKVEAVGTLEMPGIDRSKPYYTLCPLYHNGKIFTPTDTSVFMRPVIKYAEAQKLISLIPSIRGNVSSYSDFKLSEIYYKESLQTHDCSDLLKLIKTIYTKERIAVGQGKKLGQTDIRFMRRAEELLYGEFAIALDIPKESVKSYIEERLSEFGGEIYEYSK